MLPKVFRLIEHPPLWAISVLIAILVAHALHTALKIATKKQLGPSTFIIILEVLVTSVLLYITLHAYLDNNSHSSRGPWYNAPICLVVATVIWGVISMIVYITHRLFDNESGN